MLCRLSAVFFPSSSCVSWLFYPRHPMCGYQTNRSLHPIVRAQHLFSLASATSLFSDLPTAATPHIDRCETMDCGLDTTHLFSAGLRKRGLIFRGTSDRVMCGATTGTRAGTTRPHTMFLGRAGTFIPSLAGRPAQARFLAKRAGGKGGGKKSGSVPKKGPAAIKARGAIPATKVAAKQGGAGANSSGGTTAGSATGAGKAAGSGGGGGGGGGFTKSEMLAARKARKANAEAAAAAAAAKAGETTVPAAAATAAKSGAVASREGASAAESSGAGARVKGKWGFGAKLLAGTSVGVAALGIAWQLKPDEVRRLLDDSPIDHFAVWVMGKYALYSSPVKEKLLPEMQVPPGAQAPPTLVLDLEGTLLGTTYTRKKGWRVAKRPGLDAFLKEMCLLYEIVVFTDSMGGLAEEWITQMDPQGMISQRLYRDGTRYIDGKYIKDLTAINRPLDQTLIIDDNPDCISMQPENAIKVKKFSIDDGSDPTADTVLYDLAPFLRALATQGVADFRDVLRPHAGEDSTAVVSDFRSKVNAVRQKEDAERSKGLGGLVRQMAPAVGIGGAAGGMGDVLTSKDIVGDAPDTLSPGMAAAAATAGGAGGGPKPVSATKKGGLWKSFDEGSKEREEDFMRRNEAFQRVMEKRMAKEKAKRDAQQQKQ